MGGCCLGVANKLAGSTLLHCPGVCCPLALLPPTLLAASTVTTTPCCWKVRPNMDKMAVPPAAHMVMALLLRLKTKPFQHSYGLHTFTGRVTLRQLPPALLLRLTPRLHRPHPPPPLSQNTTHTQSTAKTGTSTCTSLGAPMHCGQHRHNHRNPFKKDDHKSHNETLLLTQPPPDGPAATPAARKGPGYREGCCNSPIQQHSAMLSQCLWKHDNNLR